MRGTTSRGSADWQSAVSPTGSRQGMTSSLVLKLFCLCWLLIVPSLSAADWPAALRLMPLAEPAREINNTNFAPLVLKSFQSNAVLKGIILMPGATDEFYFFHRGDTKLGAADTNLLAVITALTNQTQIRVHHRPPFLLLHTAEDQLVLELKIKNERMVERLKTTPFLPHVVYDDRDWDYLRPILIEQLNASFWPQQNSRDSWHFYRHSFAGWNLNGWETLEAIALSGKSTFSLQRTLFRGRPLLIFEPDRRVLKK